MASPSADGSTTVAEWLNISHELRTPANAILGHLDLLLSGSLGPLSSEARQSLGDIQQASMSLLEQIREAIEVGQRLSLPASDRDKEIDELAYSLHQSWKTREPFHHLTDGPSAFGRESDAPPNRPAKWLYVVAMLLHQLGAVSVRVNQQDEEKAGFPDRVDDHPQSEWRFLYQHSCLMETKIALSMIEAALATVGGSFRHQPGQLILVCPPYHPEESERITA